MQDEGGKQTQRRARALARRDDDAPGLASGARGNGQDFNRSCLAGQCRQNRAQPVGALDQGDLAAGAQAAQTDADPVLKRRILVPGGAAPMPSDVGGRPRSPAALRREVLHREMDLAWKLHEAGVFTLGEVAGDVLALADALGADSFSLIGHSMGGAGVLRVLAKAPQRVRKIIGLTPVGASPTPFDEDGRNLFWGAVDSRDMRMGIIDFTTGNRLTSTWVASVADWSLEHSTREAFHGALEAWAKPDFLAEIAGNDTPMLVIPGEHDPALGEATVRQTWEPHFPNCTIEVMPNAGHYPMFETPVALATAIERFLRH